MKRALSYLGRVGAAVLVTGAVLASGAFVDSVVGPGRYSSATGDFLNSLGVKMQARAANNAEMNAYKWGGVLRRDGFAAAGDGGQAEYTHSASACSLNGGAGDGGAQIPSGTGGCWKADLSKPISAAVWGAKTDGTTDAKPALDAAAKALGALNNGGTLIIPSAGSFSSSNPAALPTTCLRLNSTWTIGINNLTVQGSGPWGSCFTLGFAAGNGIEVGGNTNTSPQLATYHVTVDKIGFFHAVTHTGGADLSMYNSHYTLFSAIQCRQGYYACVAVDGYNVDGQAGNVTNVMQDITTYGNGQIGIQVGCNAPRQPIDTVITNAELPGNLIAAEELCNVGQILQTNVNSIRSGIGLWAHPNAGQTVDNVYSTNLIMDSSGKQGILLDTAGGGRISGWKVVNGWAVSCGIDSNAPGYTGANAVPCVQMSSNNGSNPGSIVMNTFDLTVFGAAQHCVTMDQSVLDIQLTGQLGGCSYGAPNQYHGLLIAGAKHGSWSGSIGTSNGAGFTPGAPVGSGGFRGNPVIPQSQDYGIFVTVDSDYWSFSGDLSRNGVGAVFNNASGTHFNTTGVLQ